jgi:GNAT superfamily N-acetyltransferase
MTIRTYDHDRDLEAVLRIYREVGWVSEASHEDAVKLLLKSGRGRVADIQGSAECLAFAVAGTLRYLETDLPLSAVDSVATSRIARKQGLGSQLTAQLLAEEAVRGYAVSMLGIFEQGFYNKLGFGNGGYQLWYSLDPSTLQIPTKARIPVRLGKDDWQQIHASRLSRLRRHGACSLIAPETTRADVFWGDQRFGLGYLDDNGQITHHIWCSSEGEQGPYSLEWMAYQSKEQFLELMALIQSLGDQVHSIEFLEPSGVQLQDLVRQPIKMRSITEHSPHENRMTALSNWQTRILNLEACLAATTLVCESIRFNLVLTDPVAASLPASSTWKGIAGDYTITLGQRSFADPGMQSELPTMRASVNAFTRLWLGVRSATALSWTDDLQAPESLLKTLDNVMRLPAPMPDWDF